MAVWKKEQPLLVRKLQKLETKSGFVFLPDGSVQKMPELFM